MSRGMAMAVVYIAVYFDVSLSFGQPRLFVGDEDFGTVNSSVLVQDNDVYYFRQKVKNAPFTKTEIPFSASTVFTVTSSARMTAASTLSPTPNMAAVYTAMQKVVLI